MKIIINSKIISVNYEKLAYLIKRRMELLLSFNIQRLIKEVYFMPMSEAYKIECSGNYYNIYFDDDILNTLISPIENIDIFDTYLAEIDNRLFLIR